ncbi:MAG: hypothetical protein PHC61_05995 [Chitinivibrionales bacterium]|nr:hypothetical protein [Chitinivibrionales bacterium]
MNKFVFIMIVVAAQWCSALNAQLMKTVTLQWEEPQAHKLRSLLERAEKDGLAMQCLENKVWEGIAKSKQPQSIIAAVEKRDGVLRALLQKNNMLTIAAQSKLLFESERSASVPPPKSLTAEPKSVNVISKKIEPTKTDREQSPSPNLSDNKEDKIDKFMAKQETKLKKIEQKQEKHGADFKGR